MYGVHVEFPRWEDVSVLGRFPLKYFRLKWTNVSVKGKGREIGRKEHKRGKMLTISEFK